MTDSSRPNILFIMSDDQGQWANGAYGNTEILTPNIDALAAQGMRFNNFFCNSPVCSPSRASFLTGRIPSQHGVHDWLTDDSRKKGGALAETIYLEGETAYTDILKEAGYRLGISGKWHLGASRIPQHGFDEWFVHQYGGGSYRNAPMIRNGEPVEEPGYITDAITDEALRMLNGFHDTGDPWYLSVHYTAPHSPWVGEKGRHPQEYLDLYKDAAFFTAPQEPIHPWATTEYLTTRHLGNRDAVMGYYASITAMDFNIGRLLRQLEDLGIDDNTLVVFTSDNGMAIGQKGFWGKGNGTMPRNIYDLTVKIPFIARHPGRIPSGTVSNHLLASIDFFPTLLEHVGVEAPDDDKNRPGRSFAPVWQGEEFEEDPFVVIHDEYGPVRMIRTADLKLIRRYPDGPDEFYVLNSDPGENVNRIKDPQMAERIAELDQRMEQFFAEFEIPARSGRHLDGTTHGQSERLR